MAQGVPPILELAAELGDQGMPDRLTVFVGFKMTLGHVRCVIGPFDEYVIPRPFSWWPRPRHQLIPFIGSLKGCVNIKDDATIVAFLVMHDLAHEKLCRMIHGTSIVELDGIQAIKSSTNGRIVIIANRGEITVNPCVVMIKKLDIRGLADCGRGPFGNSRSE